MVESVGRTREGPATVMVEVEEESGFEYGLLRTGWRMSGESTMEVGSKSKREEVES